MTETIAPPDPEPTTAGAPLAHGESAAPAAPGVRFAGLRLAALLGVLGFLGFTSPWTLVVILALVVMITLHELGHFVMAKRAGMKATEFFLGFGPKIWSTRRGETEYGVKAIPAGAYVKIIGMHNIEPVDPADEARTYRQKSFGQRVGVAVAGSTMHFILAIGLIYVALVGLGQPAGTMDIAEQQRSWHISSVVEGSGAEAAGLQVGDRIVAIDGEEIADFTDLRRVASPLKEQTVPVVYERDGERNEVPLTLKQFTTWLAERVHEGSPAYEAGLRTGDQVVSIEGHTLSGANDPDALAEMLAGTEGSDVVVVYERDEVRRTTTTNVDALALVGAPGYVGIGRGLPETERLGPVEGLVAAPREFVDLTATSLGALGRFFTPGGISDFAGQVTGARDDRAEVVEEEQAASAPVTENTSRVLDEGDAAPSGENRLLSIYGLVTIGSDLGEVDPGSLIVLFAMINVFIGVFNLMPLLPFDGGHVAIAVYERVQERRLHRRRYFADVGRLIPFTYAVVLLMGMLFVSTIYLDIANPLVAR
ncbi:MAG TPA: site-2 protease family protein [Acidimicrobiales bacterium]|jgi:RIP metalloprotease RseP|nr:site-2 protease family protein [Acidimicrobiales bacterium]HMS89302.1 site-2 protease family protein [Acidimicrobiales bacterium]HRA34722.1 site-2 protease family protein [Acidimicrobiales bacterium]